MRSSTVTALRTVASCALALSLGACGSSSSNSISDVASDPVVDDSPTAETGIFVDSAVANIGYRTETLEGVTNDLGEYDYLPGETVTFFIGDLEFPPTPAADVVTPLSLAGTTDVTDADVVNMIRLLQTLDQDGDPTNGISITEAAKQAATQVDFSLSVEDFAASSNVTTLIMNAGQDEVVVELIDTETAIANFEEQLDELAGEPVPITGAWSSDTTDNVLLAIAFFADGSYVHVEYEAGNTAEESGMEWGSYTHDADTGRVTATQQFDNNGTTGLTDFVAGETAPFLYFDVDGNVGTATIDEDGDGQIDETLTFERQANDGIVGTWTTDDSENELLLVSFADDGTYIHAEVDVDSDVEPDGMEYGTYSRNSETGLMTVTQTFDPNGDIGLTDFNGQGAPFLFIQVNGDELTATIDEDGDQQIDETLVFVRAFPDTQ